MGKFPTTQAVRTLRDHGIDFLLHSYKYEKKGVTTSASKALDVNEHQVIKTLVMEDDKEIPFLVLMHGDKEVSTKSLARFLKVKTVKPCNPEKAGKHTGYIVGGISPFGTRKHLTVYMEASITELKKIYINAGKRGLLAEMSPEDLEKALDIVAVEVAI